MEKNDFSDRLLVARVQKALTQAELAGRAGMQASAVSHFEAGRRSPSSDNLLRLADALGVSTDFLLGRHNASPIAGPGADELMQYAERLSKRDLEVLTEFAKVLAKRNV